MTSSKEMAEQLTEILGVRVESFSFLTDVVTSIGQATQAGIYLESAILAAQAGSNPHFCVVGIEALKSSYNNLCDRFPELEHILSHKY